MATYKTEDLDLDSFLNLEGHFGRSSSLSNINKGKEISFTQYQQPPIEKINTYAPLQNSQTFSGPSHQYDLHKQHIPLPPGALANSLAAAGSYQFGGYTNYGDLGSNSAFFGDELVDFTSMNGSRSSYGGSNDIEMDFDSPIDGLSFIDPNAMGGHEEDSPVPARAELVRVYPGMHAHQAQQAALAKQQQQMEIQRQQAKSLQKPQQSQHRSSVSKGTNKAPADPAVEARISQLLSQMRQAPNAPQNNQSESQSPPPSTMKSKKEEEEMDEDERLLASEEGKKLSSKERRQLRNKVSARAFRSRRKEYIGQLEGEVAQKSTEADSLRAENEALKAENTRLTDLTKLLLSSSAFSSFLNDLSTNGLPASILTPAPAAHSATPTQPQLEGQSQLTVPTPTMSTINEDDVDFSALENNANWNSGMDFSFAPQVFAVLEIPEGPVIDTAALSGKSDIFPTYSSVQKDSTPMIEVAPVLEKAEKESTPSYSSVDLDGKDLEFSLYANTPSAATPPVYDIFGTISFEKATETYDLVVADEVDSQDDVVSASTLARFESICSSLESLSLRLDSLIHN